MATSSSENKRQQTVSDKKDVNYVSTSHIFILLPHTDTCIHTCNSAPAAQPQTVYPLPLSSALKVLLLLPRSLE
jgi:hypothetical protein